MIFATYCAEHLAIILILINYTNAADLYVKKKRHLGIKDTNKENSFIHVESLRRMKIQRVHEQLRHNTMTHTHVNDTYCK